MLDDVDRAIVEVLRTNARTPVSEIARRVGLSAAPVSRRIERLERSGVIKGYVAVVDEQAVGGLDAFTEVRLVGSVDTAEIEKIARDIPEVQQFFTIAGDPDAMLRFRVENVDHLQRVVNAIRRSGKVSGTKTLIVMRSWDQATENVAGPAESR
ncbi:Lrp/AsnC family transcriptional regulator [Dactylosporangium sp. CA-233914]|uniref:Lrp/AsnC family transcriptional regulator n=1 Tax=Dactylosporangium sp. CA-233914 TaxID=3239934 RepID=UPI003D8E60B2